MKTNLLILMLLLPALLFGQLEREDVKASGFRVEKAEIQKVEKPAGAVERVSKRTEYSKTFEIDSIGSGRFVSVIGVEPMHYRDSTGALREYGLDEVDTGLKSAGSFDKEINVGPFKVSYSTTKPGKVRYSRANGYVEFTPAFDTTSVGIEMLVNQWGLKSNYHIGPQSPNRLAWSFDFDSQFLPDKAQGKGKGLVKKADRLVAELTAFEAWDATGKPVNLNVQYTEDSLIVVADTAGVAWPVTIDPTVQDTALPSGKLYYLMTNDVTTSDPNASRGASSALAGTSSSSFLSYWKNATRFTTGRLALRFPLADMNIAQIDSVRLFMTQGSFPAADSIPIVPVAGSFAGDTTVAWFNDIPGWSADSAAYTARQYTDSPHWMIRYADGVGLRSIKLNSFAVDSAQAHKDDTLRVMLMTANDYNFGPWYPEPAGTNRGRVSVTAPFMVVYFQEPAVPTVSVVSDTVLPVIRFVGNITVANVPPTVRGAKYWPSGTGDTVAVADTGSFATGEFVVSSRPVFWNTTYLYKLFAVNVAGIGESALDSVRVDSIGTGTGAALIVDGRVVNRRW